MKPLNEQIDKITNLLNSLKKLIEALKGLGLIIIPILGGLVGAFNLKAVRDFLSNYNILSDEVIQLIYSNVNGLLSILLVITIIILIMVIRKTGKKALETEKFTNHIICQLHTALIHKIRNGICYLYQKNERLIQLRKDANTEAITELQENAYNNLVQDLQNFVNVIAECLSARGNDTISVCIKIINPEQDTINNLEKKAKTLVRSSNTSRERGRHNEVITLGKNTDFKHLCDGTNIWYHGVDLKTKYSNNEYDNEFPERDWNQKYNSTIVVPIRYYDNHDNSSQNDILGFICIDSKKIRSDWDDPNPFELHYLALYADSLYTYIKLFKRLFEEG